MVARQISGFSLKRGFWEYSDEARLVELIQAEGTGQSVVFFSTSMFPAFPVINHTESTWAMRFPFLWFIPGLYPDGFVPRVAEQSMAQCAR